MKNVILDTNIIIAIGQAYARKITSNKFYRQHIADIMGYIASGEFKVYAPPQIQREIVRGNRFDNGLCDALLDKLTTRVDFNDKDQMLAYYLTDKYGNSLLKDEETAIKEAQNRAKRNYEDALVIAETAILSRELNEPVYFITSNINDFGTLKDTNNINKCLGYPPIKIYTPATAAEILETPDTTLEK